MSTNPEITRSKYTLLILHQHLPPPLSTTQSTKPGVRKPFHKVPGWTYLQPETNSGTMYDKYLFIDISNSLARQLGRYQGDINTSENKDCNKSEEREAKTTRFPFSSPCLTPFLNHPRTSGRFRHLSDTQLGTIVTLLHQFKQKKREITSVEVETMFRRTVVKNDHDGVGISDTESEGRECLEAVIVIKYEILSAASNAPEKTLAPKAEESIRIGLCPTLIGQKKQVHASLDDLDLDEVCKGGIRNNKDINVGEEGNITEDETEEEEEDSTTDLDTITDMYSRSGNVGHKTKSTNPILKTAPKRKVPEEEIPSSQNSQTMDWHYQSQSQLTLSQISNPENSPFGSQAFAPIHQAPELMSSQDTVQAFKMEIDSTPREASIPLETRPISSRTRRNFTLRAKTEEAYGGGSLENLPVPKGSESTSSGRKAHGRANRGASVAGEI